MSNMILVADLLNTSSDVIRTPAKPTKTRLQTWCTKRIPAHLKPKTFAQVEMAVYLMSTFSIVAVFSRELISLIA